MIIGRGLIANIFKDINKEDIIFFASGVSNSLETDANQFRRERDLIEKTIEENPTKKFVYFSTCSIYDSSKYASAYVLHKLDMENLIEKIAQNFLICRVSNAVGNGGNSNLLINYLVNNIKENNPILVHQKATRNLIDVEDIGNITLRLLDEKINTIQNIAYIENFSVLEIVFALEKYLSKSAIIKLLNKGESYTIDTSYIVDYFKKNNKMIKMEYLNTLLKRYYTI
ncbi:NAD-dependent epimerase/dehydratase family protein [Apibacter adventoris]|uniref:NAD-dependent epimerase/dehydratase family protein n=1 Tax=Apibacter adventoris TaxID=1679466 RepID=UPI000CF65784|nr:NAD-dependent epimerase/dehydratase family protein [Apibacter adventoris]PQL92011.1 NAD-dependent epimerase [Apibacter adventoris]